MMIFARYKNTVLLLLLLFSEDLKMTVSMNQITWYGCLTCSREPLDQSSYIVLTNIGQRSLEVISFFDKVANDFGFSIHLLSLQRVYELY